MRVTYRNHDIKEYWAARWEDIPVDKAMKNINVYPLKYAELIVKNNQGAILEAGCGTGRIIRYYHERGHNIYGMDFIEAAIEKLKNVDPSLKVDVGDITELKYKDSAFKYVLAFGLYHNLETDLKLKQAVEETYRVLEYDGLICASFRADNIQTKLTDWMAECRSNSKKKNMPFKSFHKMNLTRNEFEKLFENVGFKVESIFPVENMPILYKFAIFRAFSHKTFDENKARAEGYQLSRFGNKLQSFLMRFFPEQFCNIYVLIARKTNE